MEGYQKEQMVEIAKALKSLRIKNGYTNYDFLAYDIEMSRSQYGAYEKGQNMTITTLMKIIHHYGMTIFEFFEYIKKSED